MDIRGRKREIIKCAVERDLPTTGAGLARSCGVSRLTMYRVLKGEHVGLRTAQTVARRLGVPVGAVFDIRIEDRDEPCDAR